MDNDTIFLYIIAAAALCFALINCIQFIMKRNKTAQTTGTIISIKMPNPETAKARNSKWAIVSYTDSFRIVKGGCEELSVDLNKKIFGIRNFSTGFEALVKTEDLKQFAHLNVEPATIDDIVVFTSKRGGQYE